MTILKINMTIGKYKLFLIEVNSQTKVLHVYFKKYFEFELFFIKKVIDLPQKSNGYSVHQTIINVFDSNLSFYRKTFLSCTTSCLSRGEGTKIYWVDYGGSKKIYWLEYGEG